MSIGAGIAIAGAWVFAGLMALSKTTSSAAVWVGIVVASVVTYFLAG